MLGTAPAISDIIAGGEGQNVEFKSAFPGQARDLAKEIAAFATSNAGLILVGVADDGSVVGISDATTNTGRDGWRQRIQGICATIKPPVTPHVEFAELDGQQVMLVHVPKGSAPIYYVQNVAYVRHLSSSRPAEPQEIIDLAVASSLSNEGEGLRAKSAHVARLAEAEAAMSNLRNSMFVGAVPVLVASPKLVVNVVPLASLDRPELRLADVKATRPYFPPSATARVLEGANTQQWWSHDPAQPVPGKLNPEASWSVRLVRPGLFEFVTTIGARIGDDPEILVDGREVERLLVSAVDRSAEIAQRIGLQGPALVGASLEGVVDVHIRRSRPGERRIKEPSIWLEMVSLSDLKAPVGDQLRSIMDALWLAGGWDEGSPSFDGDRWTGYDR